jgi:hypothetical protein
VRPASIRIRLTLWYFGIVAATFAVYAIGILVATRASVNAAIDEELRTRFQGVQRYMERHDPAVLLEELQGELREHSGLRPGGRPPSSEYWSRSVALSLGFNPAVRH